MVHETHATSDSILLIRIHAYSLFSTRRNLSHDAKFFEVTRAHLINFAQRNEIRVRNFKKLRIARKISPSGKQA